MIEPAELMRLAIEKCRAGIAQGESPFGCAIAVGDRVVAMSHNIVLSTTDITAHAEVTALRVACRAEKRVHLPDAIVATTCEPCPMCTAALHWAQVAKVYYGATIDDATAAGFNEMRLASREMVRLSGCSLDVVAGLLADECRELFDEWKRTSPHPTTY
ncbi:MAG TPA: nucleoside deaminase [Pirellulales bacterium]|jgi:guanine deaminase|nr:nucleoside deaminase [Pirellulales bacterium]